MILLILFIIVVLIAFAYYFIQLEKFKNIMKEGISISKDFINSVISENIYKDDEEFYDSVLQILNDKLLELRSKSVIDKALMISDAIPKDKYKTIRHQQTIEITQAIAYNRFLENYINGSDINEAIDDIDSIATRDIAEFQMTEYAPQVNAICDLLKKYRDEPDSLNNIEMDMIYNIEEEKKHIENI